MADVVVVTAPSLVTFVGSVLERLGVPAGHAATTARILVDADLHAVDTHGVARLPAYIRLIDKGLIDVAAVPKVIHDGSAVATVDAQNGLGQVAGEMSIDLACGLAELHGIGWVTTCNSNHFGTVGYYTRRAADRGYLALAGTNSAAVMVPTRAKRRFIGTNPLAFAVPGEHGVAVSLDMSSTAVAGGKLEQAARKGEQIPEGWLVTADGEPTTSPSPGLVGGGGLLPLGGTEEHSSYKGYGLAVMVEMLSSGLTGEPYGRGVGPLTSGDPTGAARVSHFFMALDPRRFGDGAPIRRAVDDFCRDARGQDPVDPTLPVLVPGDPESRAAERRRECGIPLLTNVLDALDGLAARLDLPAVGRSMIAASELG